MACSTFDLILSHATAVESSSTIPIMTSDTSSSKRTIVTFTVSVGCTVFTISTGGTVGAATIDVRFVPIHLAVNAASTRADTIHVVASTAPTVSSLQFVYAPLLLVGAGLHRGTQNKVVVGDDLVASSYHVFMADLAPGI